MSGRYYKSRRGRYDRPISRHRDGGWFRHRFTLYYVEGVCIDLGAGRGGSIGMLRVPNDELRRWCRRNARGYHVEWFVDRAVVQFIRDNDAFAFKMRWSTDLARQPEPYAPWSPPAGLRRGSLFTYGSGISRQYGKTQLQTSHMLANLHAESRRINNPPYEVLSDPNAK